MRIWEISGESPIPFIIASDPRFSPPDLSNDHIWKLNIGKGEPAAISISTTYGLRAQTMQVFPRFIIDGQTYVDPNTFFDKPKIRKYFPNYFKLDFSPIQEVEISCEFWVPDSHSVCGRFLPQNNSNKVVTVRIELIAILKPLDEGKSMEIYPAGPSFILQGKTHDLYPVLAFSGSSQSSTSPFTAITQDIQIVPGKSKPVIWALASTADKDLSIANTKNILDLSWEAEIARIAMVNESNNIEIFTGDLEWDIVFAAAQNMAISLSSGVKFPHPPLVVQREPDHGYSFIEQGSGTYPSWKKASTLDAYYLINLLLPGNSSLVKGILENLVKRYETGIISSEGYDNQGERKTLDQPLICTMVWQYFQYSQDQDWLKQIYPSLVNFLKRWFDPKQDKDGDGFPEWDSPSQSGLEESPQFDRWNPETQGLSIQSVECISLGAFLYKECKSLVDLGNLIGVEEDLPWLMSKMEQLEKEISQSWNEKLCAFVNRDYESHISQVGKLIFETKGNGSHQLKKTFRKNQRLLIHLFGEDDTRRNFKITISGKKGREKVLEEINYYDLSWIQGNAFYTCVNLFSRLNEMEVNGLLKDDQIQVHLADHCQQDISQLLPLWSKLGSSQNRNKLIERTIRNNYWGPYGLPICPPRQNEIYLAKPAKVRNIWNSLVGEGLLANKKPTYVADLFSNIMQAVIANLKKFHGFREFHHSQTGEPSGENNHLRGLIPINLFLSSLGVKYIHRDKMIIAGDNPYTWPVTVKYKGTSVTRHYNDTVITFRSGDALTLQGPGPHEINLSQG